MTPQTQRWVLASAAAVSAALVLSVTATAGLSAVKGRETHKIERMTGADAVAYRNARMASNPAVRAAYEKSRESLMARGFRETNIVIVERRYSNRKPRAGFQSVLVKLKTFLMEPVAAQEYSESTSEGEWIATSWDDGNGDTWEGSGYVQRYSDNAWRLLDLQVDAVEETYNDPHYTTLDGGGGPGGPLEVKLRSAVPPGTPVFASLAGSSAPVTQAGCDWLCKAGNWARCTRHWCAAAAVGAAGCWRTGPGWLPCFGIACTATQVGCALDAFF